MSPEEDIHRLARRTSVRGVVIEADDADDVRRQKMARIILDSMYQFLGLLDVDGTVLEINQAALDGAGLSLADVVGKPFWQARWWAVSEEVRDRVRAMIEDARSGRFARCDFEVFGDQHGSRTIAIDFSLTPILDDDGRVAFLLPEGRNITEKIARSAELSRKNGELQAALERLRELDGYKTRFFANVSHELRTPLALILGPVDQLLKDGGALTEREHFRLTAIQRNARALLQQVNNLLDLARIDAERMPMAYVHANVVALLRETLAGFEAAAEDRGIALSLRGEPELYTDVDRAKFVRVLSNLLSNAFKFHPDRRTHRLRCDAGVSGAGPDQRAGQRTGRARHHEAAYIRSIHPGRGGRRHRWQRPGAEHRQGIRGIAPGLRGGARRARRRRNLPGRVSGPRAGGHLRASRRLGRDAACA